ncbi:restriction endonuclease subunit S [Mesoflavibacter zeaxanthinifaciens]|uniref:restriction endonuclease subunit S n=1 Tax=Mesoflavibacter zeaxanthinifaciens TaxID=393060 RepID=UPI003A8F7D51
MKEDWIECTLGDILTIERGGSPRPIKEYLTTDSNGVNWIKIGDATNSGKYILETIQKIKPSGLKKSREVFPGDLLLSNSMSFGRPYIMGIKGAIHDGWLVIRDNKYIDKNFLYYAFSSPVVFNQFSQKAKGSTVKNLNIGLVSEVKIKLISLPEQKAIVNKTEALFSSLDSGIADLKKAQEQLKTYRQAVLKKAFEGELTNSIMIEKELASITSKIGDGLHGTPSYDENGKYYFINGNNLNDGIIFLKPETKRVNEEEYLKHRKELDDTTVFVSINGTIGNTAFYNNEPVILGKSACYVNVTDEIDKKYLRYNFLSSEFLNYAIKNATGSTIKNVGLKTIRTYQVPLPKIREEQHQIVQEIESRLSVCDAVAQSITESLDKAQALRQSILKKAFEGKLLTQEEIAKCKAHPDYEPASVLLARIERSRNERIKKEKK